MTFITVRNPDTTHSLHKDLVNEIKTYPTELGAMLEVIYDSRRKTLHMAFDSLEDAKAYHEDILQPESPNYMVGLLGDALTSQDLSDEEEELKQIAKDNPAITEQGIVGKPVTGTAADGQVPAPVTT